MLRSPRHDPRVLELRIHGIKNTPPGEMLGVPIDEVTLDRGDRLGGFWREKVSSAPPGVRREAYSWGAMARSAGGGVAGIGGLVVQLGWVFLLPFGLANVAYWMRVIPRQHPTIKRNGTTVWFGGEGSTLSRLFSLGLTLFLAVALATVSLELIGVQCFRQAGLCAALPDAFENLRAVNRASRMAVLSLLPVGGILVLALISWRARALYEASIVTLERRDTGTTPAVNILSTNGLWSRARVASGSERLHVAAVISMISAMLAWDHLMIPFDCGAADAFPGGCLRLGSGDAWVAFAALPGSAAGLLASLLVFAAAIIVVSPGSVPWAMTARSKFSLVVLIAAVAVGGVTAWVTITDDPGRRAYRSEFLGLLSTPVNLIGVLVVLSLAALALRSRTPLWVIWAIVVASVMVPTLRYLVGGEPDVAAWVYPSVSIGFLVLQVALGWAAPYSSSRFEGWGGRGPGVVMLLALGAAATLSTLLVVGVGAWLSQGETGADRGKLPAIVIPTVYADFGVWLLVLIVALVVVLLALALRHLHFTGLAREVPIRQIAAKRRLASLVHRAEGVLGLLAAVFGVGLLLAAAPELKSGALPALFGAGPVDALVKENPTIALAILGAAVTAVVTVVGVNALTTKKRPLGLLWDLICFLPRAGHPFAAPCYSERVVPELVARMREWLTPEAPTPGSDRRIIVLSAHSLGAVLAVASIFALRTQDETLLRRVGLVTYGAQLRPFFGRFFPELFGPRILGTVECPAPSLFRRDVWPAEGSSRAARAARASRHPPRPAEESPVGITLMDALTRNSTGRSSPRKAAWVGLWRATDFLGFPVNHAAGEDPVDRLASEEDRRTYLPTVATHGDYPLTAEYAEAVAEVIRRLGGAQASTRLTGSPWSSSSP